MEKNIFKKTFIKQIKNSFYYKNDNISDIDLLLYNISRKSVDFVLTFNKKSIKFLKNEIVLCSFENYDFSFYHDYNIMNKSGCLKIKYYFKGKELKIKNNFELIKKADGFIDYNPVDKWIFKINDFAKLNNDLKWTYTEKNSCKVPEIMFDEKFNESVYLYLKPAEFNEYFSRLEEMKIDANVICKKRITIKF